MKKMKSILLFIFFLTCLYFIPSYINYQSTLTEIRNQHLVFNNDLGWISTKHAIPSGPSVFLNRYKTPILRKGDTISYAQFLGDFPFVAREVRLKIERKYILSKDIAGIEKDQVLFYIFKDVSEQFENIQGKIPFYFVDTPCSSSFAKGDLKGNLIAYYCAFNQINRDTFLKQYPLVSTKVAIKTFKNNRFKREKTWISPSTKNVLSEFYEKYSTRFDSICIVPVNSEQSPVLWAL